MNNSAEGLTTNVHITGSVNAQTVMFNMLPNDVAHLHSVLNQTQLRNQTVKKRNGQFSHSQQIKTTGIQKKS